MCVCVYLCVYIYTHTHIYKHTLYIYPIIVMNNTILELNVSIIKGSHISSCSYKQLATTKTTYSHKDDTIGSQSIDRISQ